MVRYCFLNYNKISFLKKINIPKKYYINTVKNKYKIYILS